MGFASGFRAGYDTVRDVQERRRKEELRKGLQRESARFTPTEVASGEEALRGFREGTAQTESFTMPGGLEVTPAQYEQMYLSDLQNRPAGYTVEQAVVPELGGRQYETLAAAEQAVAPSRAAGLANVYRQAGDVAEAEQLMGLSRGAQLQNLQIGAAQRSEEDALKVQTATEEIAALGRPPTLEEVRQIASANKLSLDQQFKLGESITGIASQDAKMLEEDIKKKIKGKGLDALIKIHKDDPAFDDNSFFEKSVGEDGKITLTEKSNDGAVLSTQSFPNAAAATNYLNQAAVDPANLYTWLQTSRLNEAKLAESTAGIARATEQTLLAKDQRLGLPAAATGANLDRQIKLAEQLRKQVDDIQKQLENTTPNSKQFENLSKQLDDKNADLYRVTQSVQSGLYSGPSAKVGNTINVRGTTYKKVKSGLDSDQTTWEPVEGGAAAPARGLTPGAAPASSTAPREQAPVPAGIGRMGQSYGRLTPEAIVVEGVRRGDPRAIQEQQRRREIEEAYRTQTPGYNPADVF